MSFQVCFHSFFKVLLIFPSRYFFAISFPIVFRLWCVLSPFQITLPSNSTLFLDKYQQTLLSHTRLSLCIAGLSIPVLWSIRFLDLPIHFGYTSRWMTPAGKSKSQCPPKFLLHPDSTNLASVLFTRRYWRHHCCFLFLPLLICLSYGSSLTHFKFNCQYWERWIFWIFEILICSWFLLKYKDIFQYLFFNFMFWHEYWNEYTNSFLCVCTFMHSKNHHSGRKRSWRFSQFSCVLPRLGNWDIRDIVFKSFPLKNFFKVDFWICKNQIECLN